MRLNVAPIKETRGATVRDSADETFEMVLPGGAELCGKAHIEAEIAFAGDTYHVNGKVSAGFRAVCDRCLAEFDAPLEADFEADFRRGPARPDRFADPGDDSGKEDVLTFSGDEIDVSPLASEALLLAMPMKFLCCKDCPGLCPHCGRSLAEGPCGCGESSYNPKFDALRKLLDKEEV